MIKRETNRIVYVDENNQEQARIVFRVHDTWIEIDETYVASLMRNQGIANMLYVDLVDYLRVNHLQAILHCSYAIAWFKRHPEYQKYVKENKA